MRQAAGDDFILMMDSVGNYSRREAWRSGVCSTNCTSLPSKTPYLPRTLTGLVELARALDVPLHVGEFLFSIYDYPEYIRRARLTWYGSWSITWGALRAA